MKNDITEILEKPVESVPIAKPDKSILAKAEELNINVNELDVFSEPEKKAFRPDNKEKESWRNLDIKLSDVVDVIIATSERPFFLVRDDLLVYANPAAVQLLDLGGGDVIGDKFLNLVDSGDWKVLVENIGEMIAGDKALQIRMRGSTGKVVPIDFKAIYLPEIEHFSFILIGEQHKKPVTLTLNNLYDETTGLPNFFLFEDRVQVAVANENIKTTDKNLIAVVAVNINNIETFRKMNIEDFVIKKIANSLVLNLKKNVTIAKGLKYNFWLMFNDLKSKAELNHEVRHIFEILNDGVSDNFTRHRLAFSIGVSSYPIPSHSAKKVIEQALAAVKKAQTQQESSIEFYKADKL